MAGPWINWVGKDRAGHRAGRHVPCRFPFPPFTPQGDSRPPPHQAEAGAAPGHSSAPALSRPLHSPFRARARASPALSAAPGTGTALADPRAVFSFQAACFVRNLPGLCSPIVSHPPPALSVLVRRLPFLSRRVPARHRLSGWSVSPAWFTDPIGRRQCVAVAGVAPRRRSLPAWCTACRAVLPRPPSRVPSSVGAGLRSAPPAAWHPRPSAPAGLPSLPPGQA
jgi:hypothetical protein